MERDEKILSCIDSTLLHPCANRQAIQDFCQETIEHGFRTVFVNPCWIPEAVRLLQPQGVKVGVPIGFSLGGATTAIKVAETQEALAAGAEEFDMLINLGALKSGEYDWVENDIRAVVQAADGHLTKVIIETALLSQEEKATACRLIINAGAHYVKTATGFNGGGATLADIQYLKSIVGDKIKIKAAGGIRSWADACAMIDAGASRIGTSNAVKLLEGRKIHGGY